MFGNFSRRDKRKIVKLVRERGRQPISQRDTQRRKGLEPQRVFPVKMTQTGGVDGVALTSTATWTYTVEDEDGDIEFATNVDPTADPTSDNGGWVERFRNMPLNPATRGLAHFNGDGYLVIDSCNEYPNTGPCD